MSIVNEKKAKIIAGALTASILATGCSTSDGEQEQPKEETQPETKVELNISALSGPTGMGMVEMMNDETLENYNINIVKSIDEITPKLANGEIDIAAVPANVASVLYNNLDTKITTLNINTLGVLYLLESGEEVKDIQSIKGKTIYMTGKGSTPEYAINYILEENGINPQTDVKIEYKAEATECLNALLNDPNALGVLPEPFVTTALTKSENLRVALDMTEEWNNVSSESSLVTGVVVARDEFLEENPEAVEKFMKEYKESIDFVNTNLEEGAALVGESGITKEEVAKTAIPNCNIVYIDGDDMKNKLSGYLEVLFEANNKAVGGALPGEDFYYKK